MIIIDAAVLCKILVLIVLVGEGQMDSKEREQGNLMGKMRLHVIRGKRDFMDYQDLNSQVIQNGKYSNFIFIVIKGGFRQRFRLRLVLFILFLHQLTPLVAGQNLINIRNI